MWKAFSNVVTCNALFIVSILKAILNANNLKTQKKTWDQSQKQTEKGQENPAVEITINTFQMHYEVANMFKKNCGGIKIFSVKKSQSVLGICGTNQHFLICILDLAFGILERVPEKIGRRTKAISSPFFSFRILRAPFHIRSFSYFLRAFGARMMQSQVIICL